MSTKAIRIIDIAAGILLTAGGVFCLCNQDAAVVSAGILFGLFMLAAGIAEIVVFAGTSKTLLGSGWLLLNGVLTVIMALLLLFNQWFTLLSLPLLFTLWLLFSGACLGLGACNWHSAYCGRHYMHDESVDKRCSCRCDGWTCADFAGSQFGCMRLRFFGQRSLKKASRFCKQCLSTETTFRAAKL